MHDMRCWPKVLAAILLVLTCAGNLRAQERKTGEVQLDTKGPDAALHRGLKNAINQGVDLYNNGDHYGCYRLYQGIALTLKPILADRPELERALETGLADAEKQAVPWQRAWVLRRSLDEVRGKLVAGGTPAPAGNAPAEKTPEKMPRTTAKAPEKPAPAEPPPQPKKTEASSKNKATLWERLGDVTKIVDDFTNLASKDSKVDFTRNGKIKLTAVNILRFKDGMIDFISKETGGPLPYTGKSMKDAHQSMKITNAQFDAAKADLKKALEDNHVAKADADELLRIVEKTRKDIVEVPAESAVPGGKTPNKKDDDEEPPTAQISDPRGQSTWVRAEPPRASQVRLATLRDRLRKGAAGGVRAARNRPEHSDRAMPAAARRSH